MSPRTGMHRSSRDFWRILPAVLVKLGKGMLRGDKVSAHGETSDRGAQHGAPSNSQSDTQAGQDDRVRAVSEAQKESTAQALDGPGLSIGSNFKFPQTQKVPRRPSTAPPDEVYKALEQAELWWFSTPTFLESILPPAAIIPRSEGQRRNKGEDVKTEKKHHRRRCALLGSQRSSVPSPVVLITPPTPPKHLPRPEPEPCMYTPGLHPTLGWIQSLEAQGRQRPTVSAARPSPDELADSAQKDGNCF